MIVDTGTRGAPFLPGAALGLLAVLYGFGLGAAFGAAEEPLKAGLKASAEAARPLYLARARAEPDSPRLRSFCFNRVPAVIPDDKTLRGFIIEANRNPMITGKGRGGCS